MVYLTTAGCARLLNDSSMTRPPNPRAQPDRHPLGSRRKGPCALKCLVPMTHARTLAVVALSFWLLACSSRPAARTPDTALPVGIPERDNLSALIDDFVAAHARCDFTALEQRVAISARSCVGAIHVTSVSRVTRLHSDAVDVYVAGTSASSNEYMVRAIHGSNGWMVESLWLID